MKYLKQILLKLNLNILVLGILFFIFNTNIFATTYYSTTGGAWSTVGYNGASCGCTPDLTSSSTVLNINRNDFTANADWTNPSIPVAPTGAGHLFLSVSHIAATINVESGGYLYLDGSITIENTARITISNNAVLYMHGAITSTVQSDNTALININTGGRLEWDASFNIYFTMNVNGQIRCNGTNLIVNNGINLFGNIKGQTSGTYTCNGLVVPVNFSAVSAELNKTISVIKWTTAMEQNNAYFLIERSIDGVNFETVNKIIGAGNSNQPLNYQYIDHVGFEIPFIYYRIKQVDFDGSYTYSKTFVSHQNSSNIFNIFPNPNEGQFKVALFGASFDKEIEFTLTDLSGHVNKTGFLKFNDINELDISKLEKGIYIFSVTTQFETLHKELVIK